MTTSNPRFDFTGQVVCVSGGATGIGAATARAFALAGAEVVIADVAVEVGISTARQIRDAGGAARFVACDVTHEGQVDALIESILDIETRLDVLLANAAVESTQKATEITLDDWNRVIAVNLTGAFLMCRGALRHMYQRGSGSVILTSSPHALATVPDAAAYAASKGGVQALLRALALEAAPHGVRVNALLPGVIDTPMIHRELLAASDPEQQLKRWAAMTPLGRIGHPDEIATAVLFLASTGASFITGTALSVDGGHMAAMPSGPASAYND
jgi:NAD(P)-dependent dehydrogenase (short-subunit alcohol dehydrogenase family)